MRKTALSWATAVFFLLSACALGHDAVDDHGEFQFVSPGGKSIITYNPPNDRKTIGELTGPNLADTTQNIKISDYPHTALVLNVWAQWCGPCRGEADTLARLSRTFANRQVQFIGIDFRDTQDQALDFVHDHEVPYPSIFDPTGQTLRFLRGVPTSVIPVTVVLDKAHRVAAVFLTTITTAQLKPLLEQLTKEMS